ncbi:MAG: 2Fe-2S iron-sulfur cluster-binding protein [Pseudomonadota bacterium]
MRDKLPVFRAARLVGVSRKTLQEKIRQDDVSTFEGKISVADLLTLYPKANLSKDSEYERIQHIKDTAFATRVRQSILPDATTLASRLSDLGRTLLETQSHLSQYTIVLEHVVKRLSIMESGKDSQKGIHELLDWIKSNIPAPERVSSPEQELLAHNMVLGIMSAHIKIQPSDHEFWLEGNNSILESAVRSGISLNYGCTSGNCGLCKARVVSGEVRKIQNHDYVLSEAEKNMNYVLLCSCTAVSDLVIEALEAKDENDIPHQQITTRVKMADQLNENVFALHLQTPRVQRLRFLAGQSVTLTSPNNITIDLPLASCPCDDRNLLFHIPHDENNAPENFIGDGLARGDEVIVTGPHGHFLLNENSGRIQLYIAYGTGFAPVKSLIEHAMAINEDSTMHLYWITDKEEDLYLNNLCRSWNDALDDFHYHPTIGGDISQTINDEQINLTECDVYVAGTEVQINRATEWLCHNGVIEDQLFTNSLN